MSGCPATHPEHHVGCMVPGPNHEWHSGVVTGIPPVGVDWRNEDYVKPVKRTPAERAQRMAEVRNAVRTKEREEREAQVWDLPDRHRDGETYQPEFDYTRLNAQARRVYAVIVGGAWWTLAAISEITQDPEASVSARLRDFRKQGLDVARRRKGDGGTWEYRMVQS